MRSALATALLLLAAPLWADQTAVDCEEGSVQTAVDAATTGEIVNIPDGSCTWTTSVTIQDKGIHLKGAGTYATTGTFPSIVEAGTWPLTITCSVGSSDSCIEVSSTNNAHEWEISGIKWDGVVDGGTANFGIILIEADNVADFLIHDHLFINDGSAIVNLSSANPGVAYKNFHDATQSGSACSQNTQLLVKDHSQDTNGNASWTDAIGFGGATFFVVEDSTFLQNCTSSSTVTTAFDAQAAGKMVFRYNNIIETAVGWHGTSGAPERSARAFELYENKFYYDLPSDKYHTAIYARGGTARIHNNTFQNYQAMVKFWVERVGKVDGIFGDCDGTEVHDGNGTPTGYPCLDQVGFSTASGSTLATVQPQTEDPVHIWSNTRTSTPAITNNDPTYVVDGEGGLDDEYEISDDATAKPAGYSTYTYPHPLRGEEAMPDPPPQMVRIRS